MKKATYIRSNEAYDIYIITPIDVESNPVYHYELRGSGITPEQIAELYN